MISQLMNKLYRIILECGYKTILLEFKLFQFNIQKVWFKNIEDCTFVQAIRGLKVVLLFIKIALAMQWLGLGL